MFTETAQFSHGMDSETFWTPSRGNLAIAHWRASLGSYICQQDVHAGSHLKKLSHGIANCQMEQQWFEVSVTISELCVCVCVFVFEKKEGIACHRPPVNEVFVDAQP